MLEVDLQNFQIHICERCGKEFIGNASKYSTNRFCSRSCANSRLNISNEIKKRISESVKKAHNSLVTKEKYAKFYQELKNQNIKNYYKNPKLCIICKEKIPYENKNRDTCSKECHLKLQQKNASLQKVHGKGKKGYYKGFWCDSSYELAYVIYCLDHNIKIERCKEYFEYEYQGKKHRYYPDFIVDDEIIEIKGFWTELVDIKLKVVNKPIKILYRQDLQFCFDYIKEVYNKVESNVIDLYDFFNEEFIYICDYCGKEFKTNKKRHTEKKFCSRKCCGLYKAYKDMETGSLTKEKMLTYIQPLHDKVV